MPSSSYVPPEHLADKHHRIDEAAMRAGRKTSDIKRVYNVFGTITGGQSRGFLQGPVEQWVDEFTELVLDGGMDTFVFGTPDDELSQIHRFAAEVAPAVRDAVDNSRT